MSNHKLLGVLTAAAVSLGSVFAGAASAAQVAYTSAGVFTNGSSNSCQTGCSGFGTSSISIGTNSPSPFPWSPTAPPSTLTASPINYSQNIVSATTLTLGQLVWVNNPTTNTDTNFNVNYMLTINFSLPLPDPAADVTNFTLNIQQPTNPPGDSITSLTISGIGPFTLTGFTVSNIHWELASGSGGSTFNSATGSWFNPESNTATLRLVATITPTAVPEPASFALLGAGMLGLAAARRARRQS